MGVGEVEVGRRLLRGVGLSLFGWAVFRECECKPLGCWHGARVPPFTLQGRAQAGGKKWGCGCAGAHYPSEAYAAVQAHAVWP